MSNIVQRGFEVNRTYEIISWLHLLLFQIEISKKNFIYTNYFEACQKISYFTLQHFNINISLSIYLQTRGISLTKKQINCFLSTWKKSQKILLYKKNSLKFIWTKLYLGQSMTQIIIDKKIRVNNFFEIKVYRRLCDQLRLLGDILFTFGKLQRSAFYSIQLLVLHFPSLIFSFLPWPYILWDVLLIETFAMLRCFSSVSPNTRHLCCLWEFGFASLKDSTLTVSGWIYTCAAARIPFCC